MFKLLSSLFDSNEKQLRKIQPVIKEINSLEESVAKLSDEKLLEKTLEFRKKLGVDREKVRGEMARMDNVTLEKTLVQERESLKDILPQAFAVIREASRRVTNHRHFDVQMMAGYYLFEGRVVELFTGEGKTLAANMPIYLYALTGRGAHLVTVNDYLARRDAEWNGHILNSLGLSVAAINSGSQYRFITDEEAIKLKGAEAKKLIKERDERRKKEGRLKYDHMSGVNLIECTKKEAYACDAVYGTNNEFGFDYLRDNMSQSLNDMVQGPLHFAIVDEADSILIDEARTPLIISTSAQASNDMYKQFVSIVNQLQPEKHYTVDEKAKAVSLNDDGIDQVEKALKIKNVYENAQLAYHLDNALKAKELYRRDEEYLVRNGEVVIVDEFTGRALPGRRYSEGLHQAIEAKEGVEVKRESRTMATITLQNYFRLYSHLAGMTATALTEAEEFSKIYNLDTVVIPTNKPVVRKDLPDTVYKTMNGKFKAIIEDVREHHEKGQPVLVGTTSVEKSEIISELLSKEGIKHNVLNAKQHEKEASIVREAGQKGQVTIATNMAGRGTDISLGDGVKELGGLYVIGSERHEARRIDNQLRGRSGRQGDPGKSRFYISFDDELMRLFGGDNMSSIMGSVGFDDNLPISLNLLGKTIESAQKKVEARNYDIRKNLVEYDDVLNKQRDVIYALRRRVLAVSESELNEKPSKKAVKLKESDVAALDIQSLLSQLSGFTLTNKETWDIAQLENFPSVNHPLLIWVLKKVLESVRFVVSAQLEDDMKVDNVEERKTVAHIKSILSEELIAVAVKLLGFKDEKGFFRKMNEKGDIAQKTDHLLKLVTTAFIFHVYALSKQAAVEVSKLLALQTIDQYWMEHLDTMGDLKEGIFLRSHAQRDPLVEYKNEGYRMFDAMLGSVDESVVSRFFKVRMVERAPAQSIQGRATKEDVPSISNDQRPGQVSKPTAVKNTKKVGRNDPCPCGSGKKYKKCHYPQYG